MDSQRVLIGKLIFCLLLIVTPSRAAEKSVGILLSREIAPYVAMVEGFESALNKPVQRFFLDKKGKPYSLSGQERPLNSKNYSAIVAVGPEALEYLATTIDTSILVYGMVLNPDKILNSSTDRPCGVSLNIPAESQITSILHHLPTLKRLGVLFDPDNNQTWFDNAVIIANSKGIELIPEQVHSQDFTDLDAILFIPDKSIISKPLIQYVIKEGILHNIPTIGYNNFFKDSGAALTFVINYQKVGEQVAREVESLLEGKKCKATQTPNYNTVRNRDIWQSIHLGDK